MIATLIIWFYITVLSFIYGLIAIKILSKAFNFQKVVFPSFPVICIAGLSLISVISTYFSLFIKIGLAANLTLLTVGIIFAFTEYKNITSLVSGYAKQIRNINKGILVLFMLIFLSALVATTGPANHFDTKWYHAQTIRWHEEYSVIPGLGNLSEAFAYNSTWHTLFALFSFSFLKIQSFHVLNGIVFIFWIIFSLDGVHRLLLKREVWLSNVIKVFSFAVSVYIFRALLASPSTDMAPALLIWTLFIMFLDKIEKGKLKDCDLSSALIIVISFFVVTIKLSAFPILIFPMYIFFNEITKIKRKNLFTSPIIALVVIVPWLLRNIIISGYLIYPFPSIDIFNFDWKIPIEISRFRIDIITRAAKIAGTSMTFELLKELPFLNWLVLWFDAMSLFHKFVLSTIIFSTMAYATCITLNFKKLKSYFMQDNKGYTILYITAYAGSIMWFKMAPDTRFGDGFLIMLFLLLAAPLLIPLLRWGLNIHPKFNRIKLLLFALIGLFALSQVYFRYSHCDIEAVRKNIKRIILPVDYNSVETKVVKVNDVSIYVPVDKGPCWYSPLPSASYLNPKLELRGNKLKDGFRIRKGD